MTPQEAKSTLDSTGRLVAPHPLVLQVPLTGDNVVDFIQLKGSRRMPPMLLEGVSPIHDTLGWDTVFAVPVPKVNKHFSQSGLYPKDFAASVSGTLFKTDVRGNFGSWSIATGGSGSILFMSIPVADGTMQAGPAEFDLAGASVALSVKLNYLPQPANPTAGPSSPALYDLMVSTHPMGGGTSHVALVEEVTIPNQTDQTVLMAAQAAFQSYFDKPASLSRITYVFNTVNLNSVAAQGQFQWLKPTATSYAYYDAARIEDAVFGVLCMVENHPVGTNTDEIGPGAIPAGSEAGFSIASQLFMEKMVLPVMSNSFNAGNTNATIDASYFSLEGNNTRIVNTKDIPLKNVRYGLIDYHPICTTFTCTLQAGQLEVYTFIKTNISPGIDAYLEQTSHFNVQLKNEAGKQYLDLKEVMPPTSHNWTEVATGIVITEIVLGIVGAVLGAIVGAVYQTAKAIIFGIIIAVVFGVAAAIPALIAKCTGDGVIGNIPSIDGLVTDATNDFTWPGGQAFDIGMIQLNGSLQMGGTAFPAEKMEIEADVESDSVAIA